MQFLKPQNQILKNYIEGYYFISENQSFQSNRYRTFPTNFCLTTVCQNTKIVSEKKRISVLPISNPNLCSYLFYNISSPVEIIYEKPRSELTTYFKPLGILYFLDNLKLGVDNHALPDFQPHPDYLTEMDRILNIENKEAQIVALENYWLSKYRVKNLTAWENILSEIENGNKIREIANKLNISRQYFHRMFLAHIGKSPSDYRKVYRFRSIIEKHKTEKKFIKLSHESWYFDQPHFNRDFKALANTNPSSFFKNVDVKDCNLWLYL